VLGIGLVLGLAMVLGFAHFTNSNNSPQNPESPHARILPIAYPGHPQAAAVTALSRRHGIN